MSDKTERAFHPELDIPDIRKLSLAYRNMVKAAKHHQENMTELQRLPCREKAIARDNSATWLLICKNEYIAAGGRLV